MRKLKNNKYLLSGVILMITRISIACFFGMLLKFFVLFTVTFCSFYFFNYLLSYRHKYKFLTDIVIIYLKMLLKIVKTQKFNYFIFGVLIFLFLYAIDSSNLTLVNNSSISCESADSFNSEMAAEKKLSEDYIKKPTNSWTYILGSSGAFVGVAFLYIHSGLSPEVMETLVKAAALACITWLEFQRLRGGDNAKKNKNEKSPSSQDYFNNPTEEFIVEPITSHVLKTAGGFFAGYNIGITHSQAILNHLPSFVSDCGVAFFIGFSLAMLNYLYPSYFNVEGGGSIPSFWEKTEIKKNPSIIIDAPKDHKEELINKDSNSAESSAAEQEIEIVQEQEMEIVQEQEIEIVQEQEIEIVQEQEIEIVQEQEMEIVQEQEMVAAAVDTVVDTINQDGTSLPAVVTCAEGREETSLNQNTETDKKNPGAMFIPTDELVLTQRLSEISHVVEKAKQLHVHSTMAEVSSVLQELEKPFNEAIDWRLRSLCDSYKDASIIHVLTNMQDKKVGVKNLPLFDAESRFIAELPPHMRMHYLIDVLPPEKLPPMENMIFLFDLNKFITSTKCPDVCTPDIIKNHLKNDALDRDSCSEWRNVVKDQAELEGRIYVSYLTRGSTYTCLPSNDMKTIYRKLWGNNVSDKVMTYNSNRYKQELIREHREHRDHVLRQTASLHSDRAEREPASENTNQKQDSSSDKKKKKFGKKKK